MPDIEHEHQVIHIHGIDEVIQDMKKLERFLLWFDKQVKVRLPLLAVLVLLNVAAIVMLSLKSPMQGAKVLLIELMSGAGLGSFFIWFYRRKLMELLILGEHLLYYIGDESAYQLQMQRAKIDNIVKKVTTGPIHNMEAGTINLLKTLTPLAMMFLQKEKNMIKWGTVGLKAAQEAMSYFQQAKG